MVEEKQVITVFEGTFERLFAYILRRVADESVTQKMLIETYQRFYDVPLLEAGKELLTLYNLAFYTLKERNAIVFGEGFWADLSLVEAEILRLRYYENLNSVEIGVVIGESAGKVDALLYATLVKAQRLIKGQDINEYLKNTDPAKKTLISEEIKYKCAQELFTENYNAGREFRAPLQDFFSQPMTNTEKEQFGIPEKSTPEAVEEWVPEDKKSALPEENQMGYGMDLLKTFMKKEDNVAEQPFQPFYDVPKQENQSVIVRNRSWLAPLLAMVIVVVFIWLGPEINKIIEEPTGYDVVYSDDITFEERTDLVNNAINDLVVDREIAKVVVTKLSAKNYEIKFDLAESAELQSELFVYYKSDDGRWAPRKYQATAK